MWKDYHIIESVDQLLAALANQKGPTKIISGGTDLMVELRNGKWAELETILDISRMNGLDYILRDSAGKIHIGALVTHNDAIRSKLLREYAFPLVQACWSVGSPQLRNRGTIVGNLVTASPANDTITPLMAIGCNLVLASARGEREVALADFYPGFRKTVLAQDEFVKEIVFQGLSDSQKGNFKKSALRRAQAISVLNACAIVEMEDGLIQGARITLGAVAATIIHASGAEAFLLGKVLSDETISQAAALAASSATPISDIRASDTYRSYMVGVLVENALKEILEDTFHGSVPVRAPLLDSREGHAPHPAQVWDNDVIHTTINGEEMVISGGSHLTLLNLVREKVGLTGSKVGCEEGECGACTMYLDGKAVMACLVPAPRAHNAQVSTIEGLADEGELHPVQQAFIDHAAVQCGYCTPGFVMSAAKLLEEEAAPSTEMIRQAISGNLCRCTGYYKIVAAIEDASVKIAREEWK